MGKKKRKHNGNDDSPASASHSVTDEVHQGHMDGHKDGIKTSAKKWELDMSTLQEEPRFRFEGPNGTRHGNRNIAETTRENYETILRQLWRFCLIVGDCESILMLMSPPPANVVPMKVTTISAFLTFKRSKTGDILMDISGRNQVNDVMGNTMRCDGKWIAPKNTQTFNAAVSVLHLE